MRTGLLAAIMLAAGFVSSAAGDDKHIAGGVLITHTEINVGLVADGWSLVQLLRGNVYNEKEEFVGYVHDAIITPQREASYVIVNVAGFLGIPTKLIALPASAFSVTDEQNLLLPNATKELLMQMPDFVYNTQ